MKEACLNVLSGKDTVSLWLPLSTAAWLVIHYFNPLCNLLWCYIKLVASCWRFRTGRVPICFQWAMVILQLATATKGLRVMQYAACSILPSGHGRGWHKGPCPWLNRCSAEPTTTCVANDQDMRELSLFNSESALRWEFWGLLDGFLVVLVISERILLRYKCVDSLKEGNDKISKQATGKCSSFKFVF